MIYLFFKQITLCVGWWQCFWPRKVWLDKYYQVSYVHGTGIVVNVEKFQVSGTLFSFQDQCVFIGGFCDKTKMQ